MADRSIRIAVDSGADADGDRASVTALIVALRVEEDGLIFGQDVVVGVARVSSVARVVRSFGGKSAPILS